jgi:collagenase-like PrtC family protease
MTDITPLLHEVAALLHNARARAYCTINMQMVQTYWQIGQRIANAEQQGKDRANYGDYLLSQLSRHLTQTLGKGFSEANLRNMRQFYTTFSNFDQFATQCVANLSWTNIRLIMRLNDAAERAC